MLTADGRLGLSESSSAVGLAPAGWKVVPPAGEEAGFPAAHAIDGDAATYWKMRATTSTAQPRAITVDMGAPAADRRLRLPAAPGLELEGAVERYRFETSMDGPRGRRR